MASARRAVNASYPREWVTIMIIAMNKRARPRPAKRKQPLLFDRDEERRDLEAAIASGRPELRIVFGRRGAGKSYLFERVLAGRRHFTHTFTERVVALQLADIEQALNAFAPGAVTGHLTSFDSFLDVLATLAARERPGPLVVVLDEFPYLGRAERGVLTDLQRWFNVQKRKNTPIKLFLLGSMVSWMEEQALSDTAALKSVRTGQLAVHPLGYRHAAGFYPHWDAVDRVRAFGVWGGLPGVLTELGPRRSLWVNVRDSTLTRGAKLYDEPDWLKYTDLRGNATYTSIVRAVASGDRRASDIASTVFGTASSQPKVQPYLDPLIAGQILERRTPLLAKGERPKTSLYFVRDPFLAYWYRFVDPDRAALDRHIWKPALARVRAGLDKYLSEDAFEQVCRAYLWDALAEGRLPRGLAFDRVGPWWSGRGQRQDEADVVAYDRARLTLIGECKWSGAPADERDLQGLDKLLRDFASELQPAKQVWRALFARSGFRSSLVDLAKEPAQRILLLTPADLYW